MSLSGILLSLIGLTQINQELKFLAQSSSQLKLTKESLKPTCFNRFKLLARNLLQGRCVSPNGNGLTSIECIFSRMEDCEILEKEKEGI